MQHLASKDISDIVLKTMFLKKLPGELAGILAGSSETLPILGDLADRIHAFQKLTPHIAACSTSSAQAIPYSTAPVLETELNQIRQCLPQ